LFAALFISMASRKILDARHFARHRDTRVVVAKIKTNAAHEKIIA